MTQVVRFTRLESFALIKRPVTSKTLTVVMMNFFPRKSVWEVYELQLQLLWAISMLYVLWDMCITAD